MSDYSVVKKVAKTIGKKGRTANQDRVRKKRKVVSKEEMGELMKLGPQKRRGRHVTKEEHRKWKDEQKAKHREGVRAQYETKKERKQRKQPKKK